jgi:hypothetical protein
MVSTILNRSTLVVSWADDARSDGLDECATETDLQRQPSRGDADEMLNSTMFMDLI